MRDFILTIFALFCMYFVGYFVATLQALRKERRSRTAIRSRIPTKAGSIWTGRRKRH